MRPKRKKTAGGGRRVIWRTRCYAKPIRWWLLLAGGLALVVIACSLAGPKLLGTLVQMLYDFWAGEEKDAAALAAAMAPGLLLLLGIYAVHSLFAYLKMRLMNQVVSRYFTCDLRIRISDKIRRLPVKFVDDTPVGEILQRMTDDVSRMGGTVHDIIDTMMSGFLQIIAIAAVMLWEDWRLALMVIVIMPLSVWLSAVLAERSMAFIRTARKR